MKKLAILSGELLVALSGARVAYLAIAYWLPGDAAPRFKVESACVAFVAFGMTLRFLRGGIGQSGRTLTPRRGSYLTWLAFCGLAVALYWPVISIGYLSDDFALAERARHWNLSQFNPIAFRPIPLLLWALIDRIAGSSGVHLFNIVLHGTNGYLTARLVEPWAGGRPWAVLAGSLFVVTSCASEAVAWCSGIFDVLAATLVLACVLVSRGDIGQSRTPARVLFFLVAIAALASKETAAVAGILVLLDAWIGSNLSRTLVVDSSALIAASTLYGWIRVRTLPLTGMDNPKFMVQRGLFGVFEGVAAPWHEDVIRGTPWIPIVGTAVILGLLTIFFLRRPDARQTLTLITASAWTVVPIVPVLPFFFVGPDLQGARYVYLPAVGWSAFIVTIARPERPPIRLRPGITAALAVVAVTTAAATRLQLAPWILAAQLRDRVEAAARHDARFRACDPAYLQGMPDNVSGAYVFRNGVETAFTRTVGVRALIGDGPPRCTFRWTGTAFENGEP